MPARMPAWQAESPLHVTPQEGYRRWAETYDHAPNPIVALEARSLGPWLAPFQGKRILDIGCGTGRWTWGIGIDLSFAMLSRNPSRGQVAQGDALRLPFANHIADLTLCALALSYLHPARMALEEMRRVTKPGGLVIITDIHPEATRLGWKHSFRHGGQIFEVENHPYDLTQLSVPGLALEEERDLFFGEPERDIFEQTGKAGFFEEARRIPAVWMLKWRVT